MLSQLIQDETMKWVVQLNWSWTLLRVYQCKQLINELFSENGLEYSITRTTIAGTQRVGINPSIFDNEKGNLQSGLFERPDGGNALIVINSLNDQQAFTVDHPDFGQLKMQVQPHSFNTWIYYKQTFKIK